MLCVALTSDSAATVADCAYVFNVRSFGFRLLRKPEHHQGIGNTLGCAAIEGLTIDTLLYPS